jgi:hypothetical protein
MLLDFTLDGWAFGGRKIKKRPERRLFTGSMAEREGFEPSLGYYPKHAFQACDLNRSSTSPRWSCEGAILAESPAQSNLTIRCVAMTSQ